MGVGLLLSPFDGFAERQRALHIATVTSIDRLAVADVILEFYRTKKARLLRIREPRNADGLSADEPYVLHTAELAPLALIQRLPRNPAVSAPFDIRLTAEQRHAAGLPSSRKPSIVQALAIVVHPENPVRELTTQQVIALVTGSSRDWRDMGPDIGPIRLVMPDWSEDAVSVLQSFGIGIAGIAKNVLVKHSIAEVAQAVRADRNAIGFTTESSPEGLARIAVSKECGAAFAPALEAISSGAYPFLRQIRVERSSERPAADAVDLAAYLISESAQRRFLGLGGGSNRTEHGDRENFTRWVRTIAPDPKTAEQYLRATTERKLLGVVHFELDQDAISPEAIDQINSLAHLPDHRSSLAESAWLVGFTDDSGDEDRNDSLSKARAEAVARVLTSLGVAIEPRRVVGLSGEFAIGCNETAEGRALNRRTEIWGSVAKRS